VQHQAKKGTIETFVFEYLFNISLATKLVCAKWNFCKTKRVRISELAATVLWHHD